MYICKYLHTVENVANDHVLWTLECSEKEGGRQIPIIFVCVKFHSNESRLFRTNFRDFYFCGMNEWGSGHIPTSWWPCPTYESKKQHWTRKERSKLVQQRPSLPFVWRPSQLQKYQDCHCGRETGLLNRKIHTADLNFKASVTVYWHLYSSRLILLYSDHLEDRQTVENHLVHRVLYSLWVTHLWQMAKNVLCVVQPTTPLYIWQSPT